MHIINTIDDRKFSFNGIPYLRNYISAVYSQGIEIFNCYERHDVLAARTPHNQYRVNGIVYNTPAALQTALLDVIYSRNTMGGAIPDQDNIDIRKYFHYISSYTSSQILAEINGLQPYTLSEKQSVWFIGRTFELVPVNPGGVLTPVGGSSSTRNPLAPASLIKYKMMNKGKGVYGMGGIQLAMDDLELIYQNTPTESDIAQDPETDIINFGELAAQNIHDWLNLQTPSIEIQPQNEGYTLFKGTVESEAKSFLWVGEAGTYGLNETQSVAADFQLLEDVAPTPYIPGQNEVTAMSNTIIGNEHRFVKVVDGAQVQAHAIDEDGAYFEKNDFTIVEKYADPIANVEYTKPAKAENDTYAMLSDVENYVKEIPNDFFLACTINSSLLQYKTDIYRTFDLQPYMTNGETIDISSQVVRLNKQDFCVIANSPYGRITIVTMIGCRIIKNILNVEKIIHGRITEAITDQNLIAIYRTHGALYFDNNIYISTRPDNATINSLIIRVNPYDINDYKSLSLDVNLPEFKYSTTEIRAYNNHIYGLFQSSSSAVAHLVKFDKYLNNHTIAFTIPPTDGYRRIMSLSPFIIYKDEVFIVTSNNFGIGANNPSGGIGLSVFDLNGSLKREVINVPSGSTTRLASHWLTIFNGKLIMTTSGTSLNQAIVRFDIHSLNLEEIRFNPQLITHRNSLFRNGYMYLNEEAPYSMLNSTSEDIRLLRVKYNDFSDFNVEIQPYGHNGLGSYGSIEPLMPTSLLG